MKLAEWYVLHPEKLLIPKWKHLLPACSIAMLMTGMMGWSGFPWKIFNDIPSLVGYTSLALVLYKIGIAGVNNFLSYTSRFSYEWYLVHILVFQIVMFASGGRIPAILEGCICLLLSYVAAMVYARLWDRKKIV